LHILGRKKIFRSEEKHDLKTPLPPQNRKRPRASPQNRPLSPKESIRGSKGARGRETGVREIEKRGPGVRQGRTRGHWGFLRGVRKRTQGTGDPETHAAGARAPSTQEPGKPETPSPRARGTQAPRDPARPRDPEAGKQGGKRPGTQGRGHPGRQGPRDPGDQHRTARRRTARGGPPSPATLPCPPRWPALTPADLIPSTFPGTYPPT